MFRGVSLCVLGVCCGSVPPLEKMVPQVQRTRAEVFISAQFKNYHQQAEFVGTGWMFVGLEPI